MTRRLIMLLPGASIVDATDEELDALAQEMVRRARAEPHDPEAAFHAEVEHAERLCSGPDEPDQRG